MADKLWAGRFSKATDSQVNAYNSSIAFDARMYRQDIRGSLAHAAMLAACGIISAADGAAIQAGLQAILDDLEAGRLPFDPHAEDIHMFIESELTRRIGDAGKRLHTGRSRNDQVALDLRLYLRDAGGEIRQGILELIRRAAGSGRQPPGHDHARLHASAAGSADHAGPSPDGLCGDAGPRYRPPGRLSAPAWTSCRSVRARWPARPTRSTGRWSPPRWVLPRSARTASTASPTGISPSSWPACLSIFMMHVSRLSEEIILWSSQEFAFIELDDAYSTGSSIMPQKKNPDVAELSRGKTGRVYGSLLTLLTVMKGLPLAYNKDMQEDKEAIFDAVDTVLLCLPALTGMLRTMTVRRGPDGAGGRRRFHQRHRPGRLSGRQGSPLPQRARSGRQAGQALRRERAMRPRGHDTGRLPGLFAADRRRCLRGDQPGKLCQPPQNHPARRPAKRSGCH